MAAANLENLSKSLDLTLNEHSPEEHIHRTLRAHGFFNHLQSDKTRRKQNKHSVRGIYTPVMVWVECCAGILSVEWNLL